MRKIRMMIVGPALSASGYGEHCRFLLRSLKKSDNLDLFLDNTTWGNLGFQPQETEERREILNLINKTKIAIAGGLQELDVAIFVSIPNEFKKVAKYNIGVTAGIETDRISKEWIDRSNLMDKIITISEHSKSSFGRTSKEDTSPSGQIIQKKVTTPISVVPYPVPQSSDSGIKLDLETSFNFLTFALWGERKNLPNTIRWFVEEFKDNPDVGMIVKTSLRSGCTIDKQMTDATLKGLLRDHEDRKCKVYLLHGRLSEEERSSLYQDDKVKSLVTLSHGEGFGLPIFEAACSGLPIISPNWGGQVDFLTHKVEDKKGKMKNKGLFTKVEYDIAPVAQSSIWPGVIDEGSRWCYPKQNSYKSKLKEMYESYGIKKSTAKKLQSLVLEKYDSEKIHNLFLKEIEEVIKPLMKRDEEMSQEIENMFASLGGK